MRREEGEGREEEGEDRSAIRRGLGQESNPLATASGDSHRMYLRTTAVSVDSS